MHLIKIIVSKTFIVLLAIVTITKVNSTSEVSCVSDVAFTIIADIFNNQVDIGVRLYCPTGYHCVSNSDTPCQANYVPHTSPQPTVSRPTNTKSVTTKKPNQSPEPPTSVGEPINCDGSGYHRADKCNEYYECAPLYLWFKAVLRTCKEGYFFSETNKPCSKTNVVCTNIE